MKKVIKEAKRFGSLIVIPLSKGAELALYDSEIATHLEEECYKRGIRRAKAIRRRRQFMEREEKKKEMSLRLSKWRK